MTSTGRSILSLRLALLSAALVSCACARSLQGPEQSSPTPLESARLSTYSTEELLAYLTLEYVNWHYTNVDKEEVDWTIVAELMKRPEDVPILVEAFAKPVDSLQQERVADVLRGFDEPAVLAAFERHPTDGHDRVTWYCLQYRAERGDMMALGILNDNYFDYPVASHEWAETAALFGDFGYEPAIPNLIKSLDAASLNLAGAARVSLEKLFPGPRPRFEGPGPAKRYFEKLYEAGR